MAEILIPGQNNHQHLFHEQEPFDSSAFSNPPVISDAAFSSLLRGPMYSAYAELREMKLRLKKAGPLEARSVPELFTDFRKENRKSKASMAQMFDSSKTPPAALKPEMRRLGSMPVGKGDEKKRGGPVIGGSERADEFVMMPSISSYQRSASRNEEDERRGRAGSRGIFRRTSTGFRRSTG